MPKSAVSSPSPRQILSAQYLEKHNGRKDLIRRLRTVSEHLNEDSQVESDSPEFPGLAAMASSLVSDFLGHKDKEVRLYAVLCCMELFAIYAPEAPWNDTEVCYIFQQTIRQMANLAHTTSPAQSHYHTYLRILQLLAEVKIGVVLVDLAKHCVGEDGLMEDQEQALITDTPLELLCDLIKTLLQSLRTQHPNEVAEYTQKAISSCLEEYHGGMSVPLPLVEEILISVGQPKIVVTTANPSAQPENHQPPQPQKGSKKRKAAPSPATPLLQVEFNNPSHMVAAHIIRKHLASLSTPVANLLNGLINAEPHIVDKSSIVADDDDDDDDQDGNANGTVTVWKIIYQLGKVAPSILTTVIGTVSTCLTSPEANKRHQTVKLLGKLFYAKGSKLARKFAPCFREWLKRHADRDVDIRSTMVVHLVSVLKESPDPEVSRETDATLVKMFHDQKDSIRNLAIEQVMDLVFMYQKERPVSADILQAVGLRVMSKVPEERWKALSGLSQIYYKYYLSDAVQGIQAAGDEYDIDTVSQALTEHCQRADVFSQTGEGNDNENSKDNKRELYAWIPGRIFECMCIPEVADPTTRKKVVQIVDTILLGSAVSRKSTRNMTPAARVTGLAIIMDSLRKAGQSPWDDEGGSSNAFRYMVQFFKVRAALQKALGNYVDARSEIRQYTTGSEEALAADATARGKLHVLLAMVPPRGTSVDTVLEKLHGARDKHLFRILAGLSDPTHGIATRRRATDELPKRTKALGDPVKDWIMTLANRCSMGDFLNAETVRSCISLADECLANKDINSCVSLLTCAKLSISVFPSLCDDEDSFRLLEGMFSACRDYVSGSKMGAMKRQIETSGLTTALSSILTVVARQKQTAIQSESQEEVSSSADKKLRKELLSVCTKDGTPRQARNAVETLVTIFSKGHGAASNISGLLKELTSPSKLTINAELTKSTQVISILSALSALVERAPHCFSSSGRGDSAVRFAIGQVLLGRSSRSATGNDSDGDESGDGDNHKTPAKKSTRRGSKSPKMKHHSPVEDKYVLENDELSVTTRMICAAIEFLVSHVRSTILTSTSPQSTAPTNKQILLPSENHLKTLFEILMQIVRDKGVPPSDRDRKDCRARQDHAAIRQCAATQLLRMCDGRLKLHEIYFSNEMWHIMGGIFLDDERVVRHAVIDELVDLITGEGAFKPREGEAKMAPALRFVAYIVFCPDGGRAAKVGKPSHRAKVAAQRCVVLLRQTCEKALAQCRDGSRQMEKAYEERLLPKAMPEYIMPYAFHLLCYRRETPSVEIDEILEPQEKSTGGRKSDGSSKASQEAAEQRMLKKRLKYLFEPIVHSLGNGADNISMLLCMNQKLADCSPTDASKEEVSMISSPGSFTLDANESRNSELMSPASSITSKTDSDRARCKLQKICFVSAELLNSFIKHDCQLDAYPGAVRIPDWLFQMNRRGTTKVEKSAAGGERKNLKRSRSGRSQRSTEVRFSPEVGRPRQQLSSPAGFANLTSPGVSPIAKESDTPPSEGSRRQARHQTRRQSQSPPAEYDDASDNETKTLSAEGSRLLTRSQNQTPPGAESDNERKTESPTAGNKSMSPGEAMGDDSESESGETKTLSPGLTDHEEPMSTLSSAKKKRSTQSCEMQKQPKQQQLFREQKERDPKLSATPDPDTSSDTSTAPADEDSSDEDEMPLTQQEVVRPKKKTRTTPVPTQIKIGRSPSTASTTKAVPASSNKRCRKRGAADESQENADFAFDDDGDGEKEKALPIKRKTTKAKPLGNSNKAATKKNAKHNSSKKQQASQDSPAIRTGSRRSLRSR